MCARYTTKAEDFDWVEYWELLRVTTVPRVDAAPHFAPTDFVPMVREHGSGVREVEMARWDLRPRWAKPGRRPLFNVRSESAAQKFGAFFEHQRCILPASGFWEWKKTEGGRTKEKFWIEDPSRRLMSFAGLWTPATVQGSRVMTAAILTCGPSDVVRSVHDRMPVILGDDEANLWLSRGTPAPVLDDLMRPHTGLTATPQP